MTSICQKILLETKFCFLIRPTTPPPQALKGPLGGGPLVGEGLTQGSKLQQKLHNKPVATDHKMKTTKQDFVYRKLTAMIYTKYKRSDTEKMQFLFDTIEKFVANKHAFFRRSRKYYIDKFRRILRCIESPEKIHEYVPSHMNIIGSVIVSQLHECFFELMDLRKTSPKKFNIENRCINEVRFELLQGADWIKDETPLELAVRSKRLDYVQSLVDAGVNTSAMTEKKVDEIYDYAWPNAIDTQPTLLRCFNDNNNEFSAVDNAKVLFENNNAMRKILGLASKSQVRWHV